MKLHGPIGLAAVAVATIGPILAATQSPLLEWREPIYIIAGFAGIVALGLLLVQPLLIAGLLKGRRARQVHIWSGAALTLAVVIHVAGLWITSPPDVVDVLLFRSPTPFSLWGVLAMWAVFAAACFAVLKRRVGARIWRLGHTSLVVVVVIGTVTHAWLIEGTMETFSKAGMCLLVLGATVMAVHRQKVWRLLR